MVRIFVFSLVIAALCQSCCFVRPTSAQSDRFDTHNPRTPIVECIPCSTLRNQPELNLWMESWGTNGKVMFGIEPGYNANHFRVFADAGTYGWFSGSMKWSHREQVGVAIFDPDLFARPELGVGLHQRYYRSGEYQTTPTGQVFVNTPADFYWQTFAGIRFNIPFSNMVVSTRAYRLENFDGSGHDWNFGLQFACRL
jgi:hypothetical protein